MPKDHQEHQQPSLITATRGLSLVPFQSSSLASKENLAADATLTNGRRSRVGWAPKLRLVHVGEPVGSVTDGLKRQLNAQDSRRPNIFDPVSRGAASFASSLTVNVEDISVGVDHQDDTYLVVWLYLLTSFYPVDTNTVCIYNTQNTGGMKLELNISYLLF